MKQAMLVLVLSAFAGWCEGETVVRAERKGHVLVVSDVFVNGHGPFRMMLDTGAASCTIRPGIGQKIGLRPKYAVEMETATGVRQVAAAVVESFAVAGVREEGVEVLLAEVAVGGVDGVVGQSWLVRHDYRLEYREKRFVVDPAEVGVGVERALWSADGRPAIVVTVNGKAREMVVDSGASAMVVFGGTRRVGNSLLTTNLGVAEAELGTARLELDGVRMRIAMAQVAKAEGTSLLPASAFRAVGVSNREGKVVLVP